MKRLPWRRAILLAAGVSLALGGLVAQALAQGQTTSGQKPQMAEDVFKDVQVLKGMPVDEFMDVMGFFAASLTLNCTDCHGDAAAGDPSRYADQTQLKTTARKMILMVNALNKNNFGGARDVTCYTCHRGDQIPKVRPSLAEQYAEPPPGDPNDFDVREQVPGEPSADQVFAKYIQALGGQQQLAKLTSFVAKGTYEGYNTVHRKVPVDVFAKAPAQRTTIVHTPNGDDITTYDGRNGWVALQNNVVPVIALTDGDLDEARMSAMVFFPSRIKESRSQWRVGTTTIDDNPVEVVQGTGAGLPTVKLYFDQKSGLLLRLVHFTTTPVGQVTTQVDYDDYRAVSGVKVPFKWTETWVDGQATTQLANVQANASVDPVRFAKPAPAPTSKPSSR